MNHDSRFALLRDFVQHTRHTTARRIAQYANATTGAEHKFNEAVERGSVAFDWGVELQAFSYRHDRHPVRGNRSAKNDGVTGTRASRINVSVLRHDSNT